MRIKWYNHEQLHKKFNNLKLNDSKFVINMSYKQNKYTFFHT